LSLVRTELVSVGWLENGFDKTEVNWWFIQLKTEWGKADFDYKWIGLSFGWLENQVNP